MSGLGREARQDNDLEKSSAGGTPNTCWSKADPHDEQDEKDEKGRLPHAKPLCSTQRSMRTDSGERGRVEDMAAGLTGFTYRSCTIKFRSGRVFWPWHNFMLFQLYQQTRTNKKKA